MPLGRKYFGGGWRWLLNWPWVYSGIYISIQEKDNIIDDLIYNSLVDISNETKKLLTNYMANYIL